MDDKLFAWARQVKARHRRRAGAGKGPPPLWLFTDATRLPDPLPVIARLPRGLCGVVLRHDAAADRTRLAHAVAALCRRRRLALSVAGDWRLAARLGAGLGARLGVGLHLRGGRVPALAPPRLRRATASAHDTREVLAGCRAGAGLIFISPVFATASHAEARSLRPLRWARLARLAGPAAAALGGIDGRSIRRLARSCRAAGGIGGLIPRGNR